MTLKHDGEEILEMLESGEFYAQCPCCNDPIPLTRAGLFFLDNFTSDAEELYGLQLADLRERRAELKNQEIAISQRSEVGAKSVNIGHILEHLAPAMSGFPFELCDCRSLFKPIDYVIFDGLSSKGKVDRIVFADIKTGQAQLSQCQREVQNLVERGKVLWETYPSEVEV